MRYSSCLQYNMLITPAKSRGIIEMVPFRSSILSMIKIAMIDVNAIVIYNCHEDIKKKKSVNAKYDILIVADIL